MNGDVGREVVLQHLERVVASAPFRQADRSVALLRYLAERSLNGTSVKEYTVGVEALGRGTGFDTRTDPIVRAEASRLRGRLDRYYATEGQSDALCIELPKGAYALRFHARSEPDVAPAPHTEGGEDPLHRRPRVVAVLGAIAVVGAFAAGAFLPRPKADTAAMYQMEVELQADQRLGSDVGADIAISPDGSRVAFVATDSLGVTHLRVRHLNGGVLIDLPGTDGGRGPFWSPDSRWVGFWADDQVRKIAVDGGSPVVLCSATDMLGATWTDNETIVAALGQSQQLSRIDASGGTPAPVVDLSADGAAPAWPDALPGGTHVLYTAAASIGADRGNIEIASLADGKRRVLIEGGTFGRFAEPGYITYVNQGTLYAVAFDPARLETSGPRIPIIADVAYSETFGYAHISIARTGAAILRRAPSDGQVIVARVDSTGTHTPMLQKAGRYSFPALSPDGNRLAVSIVENGVPVLSMFTGIRDSAQLAWRTPGFDAPAWTRDGRYVVARGTNGVAWLLARAGTATSLFNDQRIAVPWSFAPDDRTLAYAAMDPATAFDLWTVRVERKNDSLIAGTPVPYLRTRGYQTFPAFSRDGLWIAYTSGGIGEQSGIYVSSRMDTSAKVLVGRGSAPRWSRASQRLFFVTRSRRLMSATYTIENGKLVFNPPRQWTPIALGETGVLPSYDVGPDDRSIVALLSREIQSPNHVTFIHNLAALVRSRMDAASGGR